LIIRWATILEIKFQPYQAFGTIVFIPSLLKFHHKLADVMIKPKNPVTLFFDDSHDYTNYENPTIK